MQLDLNQMLSQKVLKESIKHYRGPVETAFHTQTTIEELLELLRSKKISRHVYYFYVVDENRRLFGVLSTRDILYNDPKTKLIDIVDEDIVTLHEDVSVEHALKVMADHHFLSIPIVDDEYCLVGLFEIKPPDINFAQRLKKRPGKEAQNMFQMIGFTIEKNKMNSKWQEYRYRMPWLLSNIFAGLACASIAAYYQLTLTTAVILSWFIPLVLTLSESISMQSMTISLQLLHYKKVSSPEIWKRIHQEGIVAILLGTTSASLLAIYYLFFHDRDWVPDSEMIAVASSILVSMTVSAIFGTVFPIILHKCHLDPKVAAGPLVLMLADIVTTALYFTLATWILLGF